MLSRRLLLIIPILSVLWWSFYKPARNLWYMAPVALICGFSILYNIPWLVTFLHMKPFYIEDLEMVDINNKDEVDNRYKFQNWFTITITLLQSVAFCIVLDYLVYNLNSSDLKLTDTISFIGGCITLYISIQDKIGKLLLACFMMKKNKELKNRIVSESSSNLDKVAGYSREDVHIDGISRSTNSDNMSSNSSNSSRCMHLEVNNTGAIIDSNKEELIEL